VGIKSAPVTIVTADDPSAVSMFASTAIDFLVKPFAVERFEVALDLATSTIAHMRTEFGAEERSSQQKHSEPQRQFLQRLAVEAGEKIVLVGRALSSRLGQDSSISSSIQTLPSRTQTRTAVSSGKSPRPSASRQLSMALALARTLRQE
jgi:FixJ family two-component response regulator